MAAPKDAPVPHPWGGGAANPNVDAPPSGGGGGTNPLAPPPLGGPPPLAGTKHNHEVSMDSYEISDARKAWAEDMIRVKYKALRKAWPAGRIFELPDSPYQFRKRAFVGGDKYPFEYRLRKQVGKRYKKEENRVSMDSIPGWHKTKPSRLETRMTLAKNHKNHLEKDEVDKIKGDEAAAFRAAIYHLWEEKEKADNLINALGWGYVTDEQEYHDITTNMDKLKAANVDPEDQKRLKESGDLAVGPDSVYSVFGEYGKIKPPPFKTKSKKKAKKIQDKVDKIQDKMQNLKSDQQGVNTNGNNVNHNGNGGGVKPSARQLDDDNEYNQYLYGMQDADGDYNDYQQNQYEKENGLPLNQLNLPLNGYTNVNNNNDNGVNTLQTGLIVFGALEFVGIFVLICLICVILAAYGGYYYGNNKSLRNHRQYVKYESNDDQDDDNIV